MSTELEGKRKRKKGSRMEDADSDGANKQVDSEDDFQESSKKRTSKSPADGSAKKKSKPEPVKKGKPATISRPQRKR